MKQRYGRDFTHIAVPIRTRQMISIMASVQNIRMYDLVRDLVESEWEDQKLAGVVNDKMLEPVESEEG